MELKLNTKAIIIGILILSLAITIVVLGFILKHQNNTIKKINESIRQERVDNEVMRAADSIKYRQIQLKAFEDSMALAKQYRDKEFELQQLINKKKIKKYEDIIKILPNSSTPYRDSIWKSEFAKPEQLIK
jgi:sensor domain CHASE-containing protein